ncbi:uncharacterized protein C8Q71DRAFT_711052 [Rhodofomes roseus]|uniref:Ubiquitin 3 binding protein But2 C-terminal domain-containing protein n=1 Tax=Rhodofomes roseus TaxID=34475 RepID=A0ABQ8KAL6_9APHY|nr:uncharacterized protein C8Q71DRAFT_711052 [Rhodofomes roseus]KAH9834556.1 hypothetical protein C8Q71DRAFT_711052 [Rhodofomes roseus]
MFESRSGYRLLSKAGTNEGTGEEGEEAAEEVYSGGQNAVAAPCRTSLWPLFICLLCTVVNLGLFHASLTQSPPPAPTTALTRQDIFKLRRPSQYIRLHEIPRPSPPVDRQFNNYPIVVAQIDSASPNKVIDDAANRHMVHSGTIVPEDVRVSTIVQFRAIDFGMERCELQLTTKPQTSASISSKPFTLEIFRLNSTIPLDARALTYKTRPPHVSKVAAVQMNGAVDTHWHRSFGCASDEVLTFELACQPTLDDGECRVEWWQNKSDPPTGKGSLNERWDGELTPFRLAAIFVRQHATV